jgi:hypothetical protein
MIEDEQQRQARRKLVASLDAELGELWGAIVHVFGDRSEQLCELQRARSGCDVYAMETAVRRLRAQLRRPSEVNELDRRLQEKARLMLTRAGHRSADVTRLTEARRRGKPEEMSAILEECSQRPRAGELFGSSKGRADSCASGPEAFPPLETRPPLPVPHRRPNPPERRRATPKPGPTQPPRRW